MVEGHLLEGDLRPFVLGEKIVPHDDVLELARIRIFDNVREKDGVSRWSVSPAGAGATYLDPVVVLAAVAVAVDREEHLGLYLLYAVDDAARPEVWGAARPHRADGGAGEQADDGLGNVWQVGRDPVAALVRPSP